MRLSSAVWLALLVLAPLGCEDPLAPPPAGGIDLHVFRPAASAAFDRRGHHITISEVRIGLGTPRFEPAGCAGCGEPAELRREWVSLGPGNTETWAAWREVEASPSRIHVAFESGRAALPDTVAIAVTGYYNTAMTVPYGYSGAFVVLVPVSVERSLEVPAPGAPGKGVRLRLVVDPVAWLYDADADLLLGVEHLLTGYDAESAVWAEFLERIHASLRLERY